ncbi:hypothetical protein Q9L42_003880 [Methylomarinum sp. Ch1-1]|uniref:DUF4398 domain-containing protein n=1 Tax=Methylomarinum roseum TaxID=3067653 RepID=A0AAU7NWA4_9GAMM|nr:hypothetical protein [Methylomarinum sp. Ch1-1]MDP4522674.1 hypothetical protein [Methylomarinum sp. Ch1-1]
MNILKSAVVAFSLAISMGTFSTTAVAYEEGRTTFSPIDAINMTVERAQAAKAAIGAGADAMEVADLIKKASDTTKEINANDVVDRNRQRANGHFKKARRAAKKGDLEGATKHLDKGIEGMEKLKGML